MWKYGIDGIEMGGFKGELAMNGGGWFDNG